MCNRATIVGRQICSRRNQRPLERIAMQTLRGDLAEQGIDALADIGGAAEDGDAAGSIELHQYPALRHFIRIDGISGAADVHRARDAEAAARPQLPAALLPARRLLDELEAFQEAVGGDLLPVHRLDELADEVA